MFDTGAEIESAAGRAPGPCALATSGRTTTAAAETARKSEDILCSLSLEVTFETTPAVATSFGLGLSPVMSQISFWVRVPTLTPHGEWCQSRDSDPECRFPHPTPARMTRF